MSEKPIKTPPIERFLPAMDWWLALLVGLGVLLLLVAIPILLWEPLSVGDKIIGSLTLIVVVLYILDLTIFTSYYLMADELLIASQLRHARFSYRHMRELRPGGFAGLISTPGRKRFALSANNLLINIDHGMWKRISVSPKRRQDFVDHLLKRIEAEREQRSSRVERDE